MQTQCSATRCLIGVNDSTIGFMLNDLASIEDLAVRGSFALISENALDHYRASLACGGYAEVDFEVTERVDPPPRSTMDTWGFVVVTCQLANVERRYRAGPSLSWTDAFDDDIRPDVYLAVSPDLPPTVVLLQTCAALPR